MPAPWQRQFRGAKHIQIDNPNNVASKFKAWRESNPQAFDELLQADYVIIHCQNGSERSPLLVKEYAEAWKNDTANKMRNPGQKICLLRKGFDAGWIKEEDWRNKGDSLNGQKKYGVSKLLLHSIATFFGSNSTDCGLADPFAV